MSCLIEKAEQKEIGKKKIRDGDKQKHKLALQSAETRYSFQALTESKSCSFEAKITNKLYVKHRALLLFVFEKRTAI